MRTGRQECLDHLLVFSRRQLEALLAEYLRHYNEALPHRGLQLAVPKPSSPMLLGRVRRHDVLGGLVHEYSRAA